MKPYYETKLGKLYHGDCLEIMPKLEPVDLVLTSPPYDNLRDYQNYNFDFKKTANCLKKILTLGGIIVWVVGDATINGSETGTSFGQALYFKDVCGLNLHDTMIYQKDAMPFPSSNRYNQQFEYMFVFSNERPRVFNPIRDKNIWNKPSAPSTRRNSDGSLQKSKSKTGKPDKIKFNIWKYGVGFNKSTLDKIAFKHPAMFPEALAQDHVMSWSNENDIVLDPFFGSGTTGKMCEELKRRWVGIETSEKYCEIAVKRIEKHNQQLSLF